MKIVTLTLSAAYDIHCDAKVIEVNHENIATVTETNAGGKGVNISRALRAFDTDSVAVVVIGDENGSDFEKMLEKESICLQKIEISGRIRENITIHTADGRETRISFTGAKSPCDLMNKVEELTEKICDGDTVLAFVGRLPEGVLIEEAREYILRLKSKGVRVVVDSRSFTLDDLVEIKPFLIKPNEEEIASYIKREIYGIDDAKETAEKLRRLGIENVMISLGKRGAVIASPSGTYYAKAPSVKALSTIGAGDSMIAGFLYALSGGHDTERALKTAVAFGSAACLTSGTNPPNPRDVTALLSEMD